MDIGKALLSIAKAFAPKSDLEKLEQVITELPVKIPAFMDGVDKGVTSIDLQVTSHTELLKDISAALVILTDRCNDQAFMLRKLMEEIECLKLRQSPPSPLSPPESKPKPNGRKI